VLTAAKRAGLIDRVRPALDDLLSQGLRLAPRLYQQLLQDAGEAPEEPLP